MWSDLRQADIDLMESGTLSIAAVMTTNRLCSLNNAVKLELCFKSLYARELIIKATCSD